ncbi:MAG TPA: FAD binding domain-containing protein, partial [Jiangellaceae bacterium]|nr:FAD binding domain-containing protein [Jiangellaceae bacterium]
MPVAHPASLTEVFDALDDLPDAQLLAGGTDFMVEVNFGHRSPASVVCLRRVAELQGYAITDDEVVLGAGVTWTEVENDLADVLPALAAAGRTVGSPQMRNAATVGGNIGTASPAGDGLPVLAAMDAAVVLARRGGTRTMPLVDFITGVKRTAIEPGEVIWQIRIPRLDGPQEFLKVGTRNAMVISIVCCALIVDRAGRTVRLGLGSVSPRPLRAVAAEQFATAAIDWDSMSMPPEAAARFGDLARAAASPISDQRGTA